MSTNYVPTIAFDRPAADPRVLFTTAAVADGAVPVTRIAIFESGVPYLNDDGSIGFETVDDGTNYKVGDAIKITGVSVVGYTGLNGKTIQIASVSAGTPTVYTTQPTGFTHEEVAAINLTGAKLTLQLGYSYVEFYGFKSVGSANTGETLVGPSSSACLQPLGLGTKDGYASTPVEGRQWNLQDWYFKVAADGDGVMMLLWK